jgi:hypothetical protein
MKRLLLIIASGVFFLFGLYGCENGRKLSSHDNDSHNPSETSHLFPEFLVGTWKTGKAKWVFTFEPDGSISSFNHFIGMKFNVSEGGLSEIGRDEVTSTYFLGPCKATYNPVTRQLDVTITIEHFNIDFPDGRMTGSFVDYLSGPVSQDGKRWMVNWLSYSTIDGATPPDPNIIRPASLAFRKIQDKDQNENQ